MSLPAHQELECDLLVAGGGVAGVCCALAAARLGARVVLCQDRPVLGGNASSEVRMHIVGATGLRGGNALETELREGGIMEELRLDLAVHNPQRSASMMDLLLYDKCRREPNIQLLLNTSVVAAHVEEGFIRSVRAERPSTEDAFIIHARIFADCTGDGRLGVEAGASYMRGREGQADFSESMAQPHADAKTLGSTLLFQARRHDRPMPFHPPPWVRRFQSSDFALRPFGKPGSDLGLEYGYWWVEWGGCLDTIKDNEHIRDELLAITLGVWNHIKNHSNIDASHWALEWIGFLPGKRESRRFVGQHVLSESDLLNSVAFADAIAFGGWPIDTHPPEGVDAPELPPCHQRRLPYLYDIPLRSCVSTDLRNLMFAGRNISATHIAFASTRVMATCAAIGQGVGTSAALALSVNVPPAEIAERPDLMRAVRRQLLKDDCYLIGECNDDPADLVRGAQAITASSAQPGSEAEHVRDGCTRSIHGSASISHAENEDLWSHDSGSAPACAPPHRAVPGVHRWMSDPSQGLPAWLEIHWPHQVTLREIILIFDTGLHRLLTLSQADDYTRKMLWGQPQPETIRDYALAIATDSGWLEVLTVEGNYQRRRVHTFSAPVAATSLRITVTATNGVDHARIVEVRAYA
jgi:hypothetical protein